MNIRKIVTILNYLSTKLVSLDKLKAVKLLYFIDKLHLLEYGRFVTDDVYIKMKYGPVPTRILDIINDSDNLFNDDKKYLNKYINIDSNNFKNITSKKSPDLNELSKSEIKIIDKVLEEYGKFSSNKLIDISHKEYAWINAQNQDPLNFDDIIIDLPEDKKEELLEHYREYKETNLMMRELCNC
jgi:uncharacterized phage-associated protein